MYECIHTLWRHVMWWCIRMNVCSSVFPLCSWQVCNVKNVCTNLYYECMYECIHMLYLYVYVYSHMNVCMRVFVRQWFTLCTPNFDTCVFTLCIWHIGISLLALSAYTHTYRNNMCHMFIWVFSHIVAHMYTWHTCTYDTHVPMTHMYICILCA